MATHPDPERLCDGHTLDSVTSFTYAGSFVRDDAGKPDKALNLATNKCAEC